MSPSQVVSGPLHRLGAALRGRYRIERELGRGGTATVYRRGEETDQWFATLVGTSPNELIYLAPSHLQRREIAERRGDRAAAVRHYRRFVELWADCDPELRPLADEVRRRIARLGP